MMPILLDDDVPRPAPEFHGAPGPRSSAWPVPGRIRRNGPPVIIRAFEIPPSHANDKTALICVHHRARPDLFTRRPRLQGMPLPHHPLYPRQAVRQPAPSPSGPWPARFVLVPCRAFGFALEASLEALQRRSLARSQPCFHRMLPMPLPPVSAVRFIHRNKIRQVPSTFTISDDKPSAVGNSQRAPC